MQYTEPFPAPYTGEYRELVAKLMSNTWLAIIYIAASILVIYVLGYISNPLILYTALEIPMIVACAYVVSPNKSLSIRLPMNWIGTALFAALLYASQKALTPDAKQFTGNYLGVIAWFFALYWTSSAINWSLKIQNYSKSFLSRLERVELLARVVVIWGATLQVAFFLSWLIVPYLDKISFNAPVASAFTNTIRFITSNTIFSFLPISFIVFGLLIIVSFRFKDDPYRPVSMDEIFSFDKITLGGTFLLALRLPIWIIIVILGFLMHFSKLLIETTMEFARFYLARLAFIIVGLVLAPVVLYFSHKLILHAFDFVIKYFSLVEHNIFTGFLYFLYVNLLVIISLCLIVVSIPPLAVRYRGESISNLFKAVYDELFIHGKSSSTAVGNTFAFFGIIALLIPVTTLLPGGPDFGLFSILYSIIIIACLVFYLARKFSSKKKRKREQEGDV